MCVCLSKTFLYQFYFSIRDLCSFTTNPYLLSVPFSSSHPISLSLSFLRHPCAVTTYYHGWGRGPESSNLKTEETTGDHKRLGVL